MGETEVLANYLTGLKYEDLPADVVTRAKEIIADTIASGLGGRKTLEGDVLIDIMKEIGSKPEATVIGDATKLSCIQAAQVNRVLTNILDYDDVLIRPMTGHMSSVLVSVALAIGEHVNASGKNVITALVPGYETVIRVREAINPSEEAFLKSFQKPDTGVAFGVTTVAGKLMGLNGRQMADAFGLTGRVRTWRVTHSDPDQAKGGMARWMKVTGGDVTIPGIHAAFLARRGFPGERKILDQGRGYEVSVGSDRYDATKLTADLGKEYRMMRISLKLYSACRYIHPTLDAVSAIVSENGVKAEDVERVIVKVQKHLVDGFAVYEPEHIIQAQFSMPYAVTMVLMGEPAGPNWYTEDMLKNPRVRELQHKVKLEEDLEATKFGWEKSTVKQFSTVEITTKGGRCFSQHVDSPKGDPENPLTRQERIDKLANMASCAGIKQRQIDKLIRTLDRLEEVGNISELTRLLVP